MHKQVRDAGNSPNAAGSAWTFQFDPQAPPGNHAYHQPGGTCAPGHEAHLPQEAHKDPAFYKQLIHSRKLAFLFLIQPDCFISEIVTGEAS